LRIVSINSVAFMVVRPCALMQWSILLTNSWKSASEIVCSNSRSCYFCCRDLNVCLKK